jgi:hypothetical protein
MPTADVLNQRATRLLETVGVAAASSSIQRLLDRMCLAIHHGERGCAGPGNSKGSSDRLLAGRPGSLTLQVGVDLGDDHRAFPDSGRHPFHRARA